MKSYSRRSILRAAAYCAGAAIASKSLTPRLLMAQSKVQGSGKNFIVVNLYGGADGLSLAPYYSGTAYTTLRSIRPTIYVPDASVLQIAPQNGVNNKVGLHPAFQPLVNVAASNIKILQRFGIPGDPGRSHDYCQLLYSLGTTAVSSGNNKGFLAKLMDNQNWDSFQYWALSYSSQVDFNADKNPPVVVNSLADFDLNQLYNETELDRDFAAEIGKSLLERRVSPTSAGTLFKRQASQMYSAVATVRQDIASMIVGSNAAGNYSEYDVGGYLRDAARILKAKVTKPSLELATKDTVIYLGMGGYDTHSGQGVATTTVDGTLGGSLSSLASNLAVFVQDLKNIGIWENTTILLISEFGRTTRENGTLGTDEVGTDHGWGTNSIVLGGGISAGVLGTAPSPTELLDEEINALVPTIDFRDVYSDIIAWLGVDPYSIFTEEGYSRGALGIFT